MSSPRSSNTRVDIDLTTQPTQTGFSFIDIVTHANDVIVVTDVASGCIVYVNPAFTRLTGYAASEAMGISPGRLLQGPSTDRDTVTRIRTALQRREPIRTQILNYGKDGKQYWLDINIVPLRDSHGVVTHFAAIERDVTEQRMAEDCLRMLAATDALTGLANLRSLGEALGKEIQRARREFKPFTLIAFDLDHFKRINDTHGHAVGDTVLRTVAERFSSVLRPHDTLARTGGEEFVVLLPFTDLSTCRQVAERLRSTLCESPVMVDDHPVSVTASFGCTGFQLDDDVAGTTIIERADDLLYKAKSAGRNCVLTEDSLFVEHHRQSIAGDRAGRRSGSSVKAKPMAPAGRPPPAPRV